MSLARFASPCGGSSRAVLRKQRRRWHRGLAEIFVRHLGMVLRRKYGVIGMVTMPRFLLFELLAPVVEVIGIVFLLFLLAKREGFGET